MKGLALGLLAVTLMSGCKRDDSSSVRTDLAPIATRIELPPWVESVRWVSVRAYEDSGWLPAHDAPHDVFVLTLGKPPEVPAGARSVAVELPAPVGSQLFPHGLPAGAEEPRPGVLTVKGVAPSQTWTALEPRTTVTEIVLLPEGALLSMRVL